MSDIGGTAPANFWSTSYFNGGAAPERSTKSTFWDRWTMRSSGGVLIGM